MEIIRHRDVIKLTQDQIGEIIKAEVERVQGRGVHKVSLHIHSTRHPESPQTVGAVSIELKFTDEDPRATPDDKSQHLAVILTPEERSQLQGYVKHWNFDIYHRDGAEQVRAQVFRDLLDRSIAK